MRSDVNNNLFGLNQIAKAKKFFFSIPLQSFKPSTQDEDEDIETYVIFPVSNVQTLC